MRHKKYREYLNSERWQKIRIKMFSLYKGSCQKCGATKGLNVHHRTYDRVGNEKIKDLALLCGGCHEALHRFHKTLPRNFTVEAASGLFLEEPALV